MASIGDDYLDDEEEDDSGSSKPKDKPKDKGTKRKGGRDAPTESKRSSRLADQASLFDIVNSGDYTHYSTTDKTYAELDWGISVKPNAPGQWQAMAVYQTSDTVVWKGQDPDAGTGVSDHAAVLYEYISPEDRELSMLVWNAQDWKGGKQQSDVSRARSDALISMLLEHNPDIVVLLETGQAGKENTFLRDAVAEANRRLHGAGMDLAYTAPSAIDRDSSTSDHDKGVVTFHRNDWRVSKPSYFPLGGSSERRPVAVLDVPEMDMQLGFLHAIAQRSASGKQIVDVLGPLVEAYPRLAFLGGDLNHEPPEAIPDTGVRASAKRDLRRRMEADERRRRQEDAQEAKNRLQAEAEEEEAESAAAAAASSDDRPKKRQATDRDRARVADSLSSMLSGQSDISRSDAPVVDRSSGPSAMDADASPSHARSAQHPPAHSPSPAHLPSSSPAHSGPSPMDASHGDPGGRHVSPSATGHERSHVHGGKPHQKGGSHKKGLH